MDYYAVKTIADRTPKDVIGKTCRWVNDKWLGE